MKILKEYQNSGFIIRLQENEANKGMFQLVGYTKTKYSLSEFDRMDFFVKKHSLVAFEKSCRQLDLMLFNQEMHKANY
jgi:hypothetical protein